jgi:2-polyprenyl-3-methyl-5-hydroxy-6-metoxy-1,4-benzoquinol methylase
MNTAHSVEVERGDRFRFGANWQRFLSAVNDQRIDQAEQSLLLMLGITDLTGKRFLDMGCGSGLFSLAARRLGAEVRSFDYDPQSVACTAMLKNRYFPGDMSWTVEEGSALNEKYIRGLGDFDYVYSWGVLHHTGAMQMALGNAQIPVKEGGYLYIAIYNDQGSKSKIWAAIKRAYCRGPLGKCVITATFVPFFFLQSVALSMLKYKNPWTYFTEYRSRRGMSIYHDWIDWLGGYPFEVAKPERILRFYRSAGFTLIGLITTNRMGCNEFLFQKNHNAFPNV